MNLDARRMSYLLGIAGVTVVLIVTLAAALSYSAPDGSPYSILNRKISTLGKPGHSLWAALFNWGLSAGGLLLAGFMIGLGFFVRHRAMLPVALAGIVMTGGIVLVGLCPVTEPECHRLGAKTVFVGGATTIFLFTVVLLFSGQKRLPTWLAVPSAAANLALIIFVLLLEIRYKHPVRVFIQGPLGDERPYLWLPSLVEWLFFFIGIAWFLLLSLYLLWQERAELSARPHATRLAVETMGEQSGE